MFHLLVAAVSAVGVLAGPGEGNPNEVFWRVGVRGITLKGVMLLRYLGFPLPFSLQAVSCLGFGKALAAAH